MNENSIVEQHTVRKSLLLHLLPGLLIGVVYFLLVPVFHRWGYPSIMPLMCAVVLVLIPFEFGVLLFEAKKKNGTFSLNGVVLYRKLIPFRQYLLWVPILFVLLGLIFTLMKPIDTFLQTYLFSWIPPLESGLTQGYSREVLIISYIMVAVFGTVLGPLTEELYFRGYLLPRMAYAGKWAPLLHSFLFALYHFMTPWMIITRTLGMLPLVIAVQKRSLYLSIVVHILLNSLDVISAIVFISAMN